ncbi:hypothetical protein L249_4817, partial [Ophiocordyceps polyrhachis-furcata BCC 54312]
QEAQGKGAEQQVHPTQLHPGFKDALAPTYHPRPPSVLTDGREPCGARWRRVSSSPVWSVTAGFSTRRSYLGGYGDVCYDRRHSKEVRYNINKQFVR